MTYQITTRNSIYKIEQRVVTRINLLDGVETFDFLGTNGIEPGKVADLFLFDRSKGVNVSITTSTVLLVEHV